MAITRIHNNQISDKSIVGSAKISNQTVTANLIANNLVYDSSLTVTGNLSVQGSTTTLDTVSTVIEDPTLLLAKDQTGSPTTDIGFIGERGDETNIAFVWDESEDVFVTAFTTDSDVNTAITVSSIASFKTLDANITGNAEVGGDLTLTGNIAGDLNVTGNIEGSNLISNGVVSATGNVSGSNIITTGIVSATGNVSGGNISTAGAVDADTVTATGNVAGGNITTGGAVAATGNVTGGNLITAGDVEAATGTITDLDGDTATFTGNVSGGNISTAGVVSATGNVTGGNITTAGDVEAATGTIATLDGTTATFTGNVDGDNLNATNKVTAGDTVEATGNVIGGNITTAGSVDATGNLTGGNVVSSGDVSTVTVTATGNVAGGNLTTGGVVDATGNVEGANFLTGGTVDATGNVDGGNINTGGVVVATGNIDGGNINTAGVVEATGNVAGGNLTTAGEVDATGNVNGGNVVSGGDVSTVTVTATGNVEGANLVTAGDVTTATVTASGNIEGGNISTAGDVDAATGTIATLDGTTASFTGNVSGGNISTAGDVEAATGTITDLDGDTASFTGNVSGGNIATAGVVSATGNVTGGNLITAGTVDATGNVTGGNLSTAGDVEAATGTITDLDGDTATFTGNVSGGNISTAGAFEAGSADVSGNVDADNVNTDQVTSNNGDLTLTAQAGNNSVVLEATGTGTISANSTRITNLAEPTQATDATTKQYVDGVAQGLDIKGSVKAATTAALASFTYDNGTDGVGATITADANGALEIDGVTIADDDIVLIKNEAGANAPYNGIYVATEAGDASTAFVLTRATNFDVGTEMPGGFVFVEQGTTNEDAGFVCTTDSPVTVGTTDITFEQFSGAGSIVAGEGLAKSGNEISANVDDETTAIVADTIVVKASANLTTPNIGNATGNSLTLTGNGQIDATTLELSSDANIGGAVDATGNVTGGNLITAGDVEAATGTITDLDGDTATFTGNVEGGNLITAGAIDATGNVTGGNLSTAGDVEAATGTIATLDGTTATFTGNVSGGNLTTAGDVEAATGTITDLDGDTATFTGNVEGGNLVTAGDVTTATVTATGNVDGGNINTGGVVVATGNVSGGNLLSSGIVQATGNVDGGNITTAGVVDATGDITSLGNVTGANLVTGGIVDATGNVSGGNITTGGVVEATGNVAGGNITTAGVVDATGNVDGGNINTAGIVSATGNVTGGNLLTGGFVEATGNVAGGNITTAGTVDATGNVTGGNLITAGDVEAATGTIATLDGTTASFTGNVEGGNLITAGAIDATGNVTGGNLITAGTVDATGNVTGGNLITAGDVEAATGTIATLDGTTATFTGNVEGGNLITAGAVESASVDASGAIVGDTIEANTSATLASAAVSDLTDNRVVIAGTSGELEDDANFTFDGSVLTVSANASVSGTADVQTALMVGDVLANLTSDVTLEVASNDSMLIPVGTTAQRPGSPVTGMVRFNTTTNNLEFYDNDSWETAGSAFTVVTSDTFTGDGSTTAFTLAAEQTTNSVLVFINGVSQEPGTAYSVSGTTITFTEAPVDTDEIEVRGITTTSTVGGLSTGNISFEGNTAAGAWDTTGHILPTANVTYDLGSLTKQWRDVYVGPGSLYVNGQKVLEDDSGTITVQADEDQGLTVKTSGTGVTTVQSAAGLNLTATGSADITLTTGTGQIEVEGDIVLGNGYSLSQAGGGDMQVTDNVDYNNNNLSNIANVEAGNLTMSGDTISSVHNIINIDPSTVGAGGTVIIEGNLQVTGTTTTVDSTTVTINDIAINVANNASTSSEANGGGLKVGPVGSEYATFTFDNSNTRLVSSVDVQADTFHGNLTGTATQAEYADLAENYSADADYEPGTVVCFGGDAEVTVCEHENDHRVAGVITTNPAHLMNSAIEADHVAGVALTGRVPCKVTGPVAKGDLMVSAGNGTAKANNTPNPGTIIGKALENFDGTEGVIEVVVGRF